MVAIARQYGAAAKFSGSGGAIVGLLLDPTKRAKLAETFQTNGFVFIDLVPNPPGSSSDLDHVEMDSSSCSDTGTTL